MTGLPVAPAYGQEGSVLTLLEGDAPILSIGVLGGDPQYELYQIEGAVRLSDGSVVVMVAGELEVRRFDSGGKHVWTKGRRGEGPVEFRLPALLSTCTSDDRIVIHDRMASRITVLNGEDGELKDDYRVDFGDKRPYSQIRCSPSGRMVFTTYGQIPKERTPGPYRWTMGLYFTDHQGSGSTAIRDGFLGTERVMYFRDGRPYSEGPRTWGRDPVFAVTDDGIWFGTADRHEIELLDWQGGRKHQIEWEGRDLNVTAKNLEGYRNAIRRLYEVEGGDWRSAYEKRLARDLPNLPSTFPAYADIQPIGEQIWVKEYWRYGDQEQRWIGFEPDGTMIGTMILPAHLNIQQFGPDGDWLLAITTDRLGVERLVRPRAPRALGCTQHAVAVTAPPPPC